MQNDDAPLPSVLVVDDTPENLRLLATLLGSRDFDVRPVTNGDDALRVTANDPPDLILLDVTMPGMDGFEVCRQLRAKPESRDIPVIFLTALTDVGDKVKGFAAGGNDYITKPFQLEEVVARVGHHLALRRAQRDLQASLAKQLELEQLRDDLVHMIVHDFRSPLTALLGGLELAKTQVSGTVAEYVDMAYAGAESLNEMANTLLDVRRMEEGKMPLNLATSDLVAVAGDSARRLASMDRSRTIEVAAASAVAGYCDAELVRRVLENLVSNAIKHTPKGGTVVIRLTGLGDRVRLAVEDSGQGIPVEARSRIFEKFGAMHARTDRSYHSVGLGLAFCKLAVEAHGGTIGIESAVPHGSIFWFELPQAAAA
jgi:two-component system sensor histidine kinase/response regulator